MVSKEWNNKSEEENNNKFYCKLSVFQWFIIFFSFSADKVQTIWNLLSVRQRMCKKARTHTFCHGTIPPNFLRKYKIQLLTLLTMLMTLSQKFVNDFQSEFNSGKSAKMLMFCTQFQVRHVHVIKKEQSVQYPLMAYSAFEVKKRSNKKNKKTLED